LKGKNDTKSNSGGLHFYRTIPADFIGQNNIDFRQENPRHLQVILRPQKDPVFASTNNTKMLVNSSIYQNPPQASALFSDTDQNANK
jgi:hypothetical protein